MYIQNWWRRRDIFFVKPTISAILRAASNIVIIYMLSLGQRQGADMRGDK
jgi:hypothetical protein